MEKKLPEMFANKIDKPAGNNNKIFYSSNEERAVVPETPEEKPEKITKNINQKIRDIFNSSNYVYKADVEIEIGGKTVVKRIVGRNSNHLITIDNELIPITEITDIQRK